jgi:hypothetical protein
MAMGSSLRFGSERRRKNDQGKGERAKMDRRPRVTWPLSVH